MGRREGKEISERGGRRGKYREGWEWVKGLKPRDRGEGEMRHEDVNGGGRERGKGGVNEARGIGERPRRNL